LFLIGMFLAVVGIVLSMISFARSDEVIYVFTQVWLFVFLGLATYNDLRQITVGDDISGNRIVGAICVYLMLGVMWSIAYAVLEFLQPGSFSGLRDAATSAWDPDWIYFSFVTMTTVGYGDVLAISTTARSIAIAEAVVGQFYIAILVAGLVSAYISTKPGKNSQD
jgi:hypothetical protein